MKNSRKIIVNIIVVLAIVCLHLVTSLDLDRIKEYEPYVPTSNTGEILAGDEWVQDICIESDELLGAAIAQSKLQAISLFAGTIARKNASTLYVNLTESQSGECLECWEVDCLSMGDNAYYTLMLSKPLLYSPEKTYQLQVTSNAIEGDGIVIHTCEADDIGGLTHNGEALNASLVYKLRYKQTLASKLDGANGFHVAMVIVLTVLLIAGFALYEKLPLENAFLILWTGLSIMYMFALPALNVPDEYNHFSRAYEISERHFMSDYNELTDGSAGRYLPFDVDFTALSDSWESYSENKDMTLSDNLVRVGFSNTAIQTPLSYIPQSIGIFIARHVSHKLAFIIYFARTLSWLCVTALLYFAVKLIPCDKEIMMLIPLLPMSLQQAVSLSPDGMVLALSLFITAFVLRQKLVGNVPMKPAHYVIIYVSALLIALNKVVYLPFCLIFLLIPYHKFGGKRNKAIHTAIVAALTVGFNVLWLAICSGIPSRAGANTSLQVAYILRHPVNYLMVLWRSWYAIGGTWLQQMLGSSLGSLNVDTSALMMLICLVALVCISKPAASARDKEYKMTHIVFAIVLIAVLILVPTGIYVQWSQVYAYSIEGVQGRYFMSLILPTYYVFNRPCAGTRNTARRRVLSIWLVAAICSAIDILIRFI